MKAIKYTGPEGTGFTDQFDGQQFIFIPGEVTRMSDQAAKHFFGIGGDANDRYVALRRNGHLNDEKWLKLFKVMKVEERIIDPTTKKVITDVEKEERVTDPDDAEPEGPVEDDTSEDKPRKIPGLNKVKKS